MTAPLTYAQLSPAEQAAYDQSLQGGYYAGLVICTVSIVIAVGLRWYAQWLINCHKTLDMWLAIAAFVFTLAMNACNFVSVAVGGGLHVWRVFIEDPNPPQHLIQYHQAAYLLTVFNAPSYCLIKLSMLAFLHRIFASQGKWFRWTVYVIAGYSILLGIGTTIEFILQAIPPSAFWNRAYLSYAEFTHTKPLVAVTGYFMPQNLHTAIPLVAAMVSDVPLILLPWAGLWGVRLTRVKKFGIAFALSLGLFALALDIVRLWEVFQISNSLDETWLNTPSLLWSSIEYSVALVCVCIPGMAPMLRHDRRSGEWKTDPFHSGSDTAPKTNITSNAGHGKNSRPSEEKPINTAGSETTSQSDQISLPASYPYHTANRATASGGRGSPRTGDAAWESEAGGVHVTTELDIQSWRGSGQAVQHQSPSALS